MATSVTPFLMFEGRCEEAVNFYVTLLPNSEITGLTHFGDDGPKPGQVNQVHFTLGGRAFRAFDSPVHHGFTFTPAMSIFIDCETEAELDTLFARLSEGGEVLMPLGDYGFSRKFGWTNDRFGVSWQLNLP